MLLYYYNYCCFFQLSCQAPTFPLSPNVAVVLYVLFSDDVIVIPLVASAVILTPFTLRSFTFSTMYFFKAVVFVVFTLILQQIDGNIIGPKILGDTIGMDSFFVLFSILLFGGLFGFAGMMLGVPVFAVLQRIIIELMDSKLKSENLPTDLEAYKVE